MPPVADEHLADWVGFPEQDAWGDFYREAHRRAVRAMLDCALEL